MRKLIPLLFLVLVSPAGAAADGCPPATCGTATVAVPGSPVLQVRANGTRGPLAVYDLGSGKRAFSLPAGMLSADGRTYVTSRSRAGATTLSRFDGRTGAALGSSHLQGAWSPSAISANGRWLALVRRVKKPRRTFITVADTRNGAAAHTLVLDGMIEPEAVANRGNRLFVIQYLRRGYIVRALELASGRLTTLRAKGDPTLMGGTAWNAVASPDGRWLLTLYFEPDGGAAVHTLDLRRRVAVCIDIPSGNFTTLTRYAIAIAPDGSHAYAVNAALGAVAEIDLARLRVTRVGDFAGSDITPGGPPIGSTAVAAPSGTVYFTGGIGLWSYANGETHVLKPGGKRILGLGLSPSGRKLLVVRAGGVREFLTA